MNDKTNIKSSSKELNSISKQDYLNVDNLKSIETIVDKLEGSTLASQFVEKKFDKDKDGNIIEASCKEVFNRGDMILCLGLGSYLGMSPFVALSYGKALNLNSIKKIEKGKQLGLDYNTSLDQIYIWGTGSKEIVYTSIHVVNTVLKRLGVSQEVIQYGTEPIYKCVDAQTLKEIDYDAASQYVIPKNLPQDKLKPVIDNIVGKGLTPIYKEDKPLYIGEVKLTRFNKVLNEKEYISIPYSSQQAIDAGLLKGINSITGEEVKGKDNWNAHPSTHLLKMSVMIGARMIAADALNAIYIPDELSVVKTRIEDELKEYGNIEDATILDEKKD